MTLLLSIVLPANDGAFAIRVQHAQGHQASIKPLIVPPLQYRPFIRKEYPSTTAVEFA